MADPEQRPRQQASGGVGKSLAGVHLATLATFAISQPLLDLIRQHPSLLSALRASALEIVCLTFVLSFAIPGLFFALGKLGQFLPRGAQPLWSGAWIALLSSLIVLPLGVHRLPTSDPVVEKLVLVGALGIGLGVAWGVAKWSAIRLFLTFLAPAILAFPLLFLASPSIRKLVLPPPPIVTHDLSKLPAIPIVVVVFDELPLTVLLGQDHRIDATRFPNFAALAQSSHWYPHATSVEIATIRALPAILTGRSSTTDRNPSPSYAEYPDNLFTWLGGASELEVVESFTRLCPEQLCQASGAGLNASSVPIELAFGDLLADLALVYCHFAFPPRLIADLPSLGGRWGGFWQDGDQEAVDSAAEAVGEPGGGDHTVPRAEVFQAFVDRLQPMGDRARLYFLHVLLPHWPWEYLPDLSRYNDPLTTPGRGRTEPNTWHADPWYSQASYHRLSLQTQATDLLLGRLMDRLEELGLWDPAIVFVTADHGLSFEPGQTIRGYDHRKALLTELLPIPLFLKTPGQKAGIIDPRLAENFDLLPTLADLLEVSVPWETEGFSLVAERQRSPQQASIQRIFGFPPGSREELTEAKYQNLYRELGQVSLGARERRPTEQGSSWRDQLVGRQLEELVIEPGSGEPVVLSRPELYRAVDPASGFVPAHVMGTLRYAADAAPRENPREFLAVAVNGVIHGIARTEEPKNNTLPFSTILPASAFFSGTNRVEILKIKQSSSGEVSLVATKTTAVQDFAQQQFEAAGAPLLRLDPATDFSGVEALHLVEVHRQPGSSALVLDAVGMDPALRLPSAAAGDATSLHLAIDLTVPEDTEVRVFFQTESESRFWWGNSVQQPIAAGRSTMFVELHSAEGFAGPLRLDPGNRPGRYLLHSIEVRNGAQPPTMREDSSP